MAAQDPPRRWTRQPLELVALSGDRRDSHGVDGVAVVDPGAGGGPARRRAALVRRAQPEPACSAQLSGAIGVCAAVAAIALAGGEPGTIGSALWMILAARAIGAIPFVRAQIVRLRHGAADVRGADLAQGTAARARRSPSPSSQQCGSGSGASSASQCCRSCGSAPTGADEGARHAADDPRAHAGCALTAAGVGLS